MKKLVLVDHEGKIQLVHDVYSETGEFEYASPTPKAYWLGKIAVVSIEAYEQMLAPQTVVSPPISDLMEKHREPEEEATEVIALPYRSKAGPDYHLENVTDKLVFCKSCDWKGTIKDCGFGHGDYYCPDCGSESVEEDYIGKPATTDNQSPGDTGPGETDEPESVEATPEKPAKRKAAPRSKRVRDGKATEDTLGGGTE